MAEWIKVESTTPLKPEVVKMARILARPRSQIFGALVMVWCWFDRNSVDGAVDGMVSTDIDEIAGLKGFAAAMEAVNWLAVSLQGQKLVLPNFERHNGESAKKRALKSDRQRRWRDAPVDAPVDVGATTRVDKNTRDLSPPTPLEGGRRGKTAKPTGNGSSATLHCSYCSKPHTATANGLRACDEHFQKALDNERPGATQPTHAREASAEDRPKLDPDQGYPVKAKRGKFDDEPGDDSQRLSDLPPGT